MARSRLLHLTTGTLTAAALAGALLVAGPALAEPAAPPAPPTTAEDAKTAWIDAAHGVEELNQAVLTAQQQVTDRQAAAAAAQSAAAATVAAVTAADAQVAAADAQVAAFRPTLDAVANASLKGARFSSLSSLLTADSADDYLDQVTALDQVAGDTLATMAAAQQAGSVADAAKAAADATRAQADRAAAEAAAAVVAAEQAAADVAARQVTMRAEIVRYEQVYSALTVAERGEAIEAFENSNLSPEAQVKVDREAAARAAAGITENNLSAMAVSAAPDTAAGIAVAAALTRRGMPYVWGAVGPDEFDCSGLMLWAWQQAGVTIPRTSAEQATLPSVPMDQLQPGDLVTFYSPVSHVGMYIGHGLLLHASTTGTPVKVIAMEKAGPNATGHRVPR
ncbi:C40 family peptidase [Nakamurella deserti]|uniref:C40 family peptidase n=1 Tax=Nakamurella deserti TaxID=2164074 RepID=UPI0013004A32|nr:C40 family peptidase [Nakamurella deserti]